MNQSNRKKPSLKVVPTSQKQPTDRLGAIPKKVSFEVLTSQRGMKPAHVEFLGQGFGWRGRALYDDGMKRRMYKCFKYMDEIDFFISELPLAQGEHVLVALRELLDASEGMIAEIRAAGPETKKKAA